MEDVPHFRCLKIRQTEETARKGYSPVATLPGCFIVLVVIGKRPKREQRLNDSKELEQVLPSLGIRDSRSIKSTVGFEMPDTYLPWNSTCHFNHELMELGKQFADLGKPQRLYMMVVWGHSYEFTKVKIPAGQTVRLLDKKTVTSL